MIQVHDDSRVFRSALVGMPPENESDLGNVNWGKLERDWMTKHKEKWHDQDAPRDVQRPG